MPFKTDMAKANLEGWAYGKDEDPMPTQNPYDPVSRDVTGAEQWPGKTPAVERFDRFIRELMANGYTEAEIEAGLEQTARSYIRPTGDDK